MAQYKIPDPEDLIECPYDKVHMVRAKRFPYHLMKCRKNYSGSQYANCPFNARHEMPKPELRYHMLQCPNRAMIEQDIYYNRNDEGQNFKGNTDVPSYYPDWEPPVSSEDWDREAARVPRIGVDKKVLYNDERFRDTTGMTRAEKKKLAEKLKRKIQGLPDADDEEEATNEPAAPTTASGMRLPRQTPAVLQNVQFQQQPANPAQSSQVFEYSLSMAGIGRGKPRHQSMQPVNGTHPQQVGAYSSIDQSSTHNQSVGVDNAFAMRGRGRGALTASVLQSRTEPTPGQQQPTPVFNMFSAGRGIPVQNNQLSFVVPMMENGDGPMRRPRNVALAACMRPPPGFQTLPPGNGYAESNHSQDTLSQDSDVNSASDVEEQKQKERRKLEKKLRQIEDLELAQSEGKELNADQQAKIDSKDSLVAQINNLRLK